MGKGRAPCCDKNQVKRGPWSPAEDLRLITFIQNHGHDNWRALPKQAGLLRCGKSCRLRWINYLRPDVKRGNFTQDEEDAIIKLHKAWGNKWSKIASRLPGRTDNEIKNVWNTHLKKRLQGTKVSDSSGDESKESSPTTSSSSSSSLLCSDQTQNLDAEPVNKDSAINNNQLMFLPLELESESPADMGIEIPLECDIEFWNMLDLENMDLFESSKEADQGCQGSNFGAENGGGELLENDKWFKFLENELGLDHQPEENTRAEETAAENSAEALRWSETDPEVDSCMAYFADGFPRQP